MNQAEVAKICSVTDKTVGRWEAGHPAPSDKLLILQEIGFDLFYVFTGGRLASDNEKQSDPIENGKTTNKTTSYREKGAHKEKGVSRPFQKGGNSPGVSENNDAAYDVDGAVFELVPRYDVDVSAGPGANGDQLESEIGRLAFRRDWLRQKGLEKGHLVVVRVRGDSMAPTIQDGALALVDTRQERAKEDGVYVLILDGHIVAKRLQVDFKGGVFIRSDNTAYREQHLNSGDCEDLYIIGRVVWAGGDI